MMAQTPGVGMAGRGSPAKSAGSARPKKFFLYFRIYVSNSVVIHRSEVPVHNLISAGPAGQRTSSWESSRPYLADLMGGCRPGRPHQPWPASIRPSPAAGRPRPAPSDTAGRGGWRWLVPAEAGRSWPAPAGGGRGWPVIALGILLVCRAHRGLSDGQ